MLAVSVPYWGSNYLIDDTLHYWTLNLVSVPYWGSNYLINVEGYEEKKIRLFPSPTGVLII